MKCDLAAAGVAEKFGEYGNTKDGIGCGTPFAPWLYVNHEPMRLAGGPEGGKWYTFTEATDNGDNGPGAFIYNGPELEKWKPEESGLWLYGYWSHDWACQVLRVASIDRAKKEVRFADKAVYGIGKKTWGGKERRFRSINSFEELDTPGEWWLDRPNGVLYLYPPTDLANAEVKLAWKPDSALYVIGQTNVVIRGRTFAGGMGNGVEIKKSRNVLIADCVIEGFTRNGVEIDSDCSDVVVSNCVIRWTGLAGVKMGGGDRRNLVKGGNSVVDCEIAHFGIFQRVYAPAVKMEGGCGQVVRRCHIHDGFHTAILYGGGNEHLIELNDIHDVVTECGDAGALYSGQDWTSQGNVVRWNRIHHLGAAVTDGKRSFTMGVYLDDLDSGDTVASNIFVKAGCAVFLGGGRDNRVVGNVMIDCETAIHLDSRGIDWGDGTKWILEPNKGGWGLLSKACRLYYQQEPWASRYPSLLRVMDEEPQRPLHNVFEGNRGYRCGRAYDFDRGVLQLLDSGRLSTNDTFFAEMPDLAELSQWYSTFGK